MILPIVCNSESDPTTVATPHGFNKPPSRIICQTCSGISESEYRKDKKRCRICFILPIPCGTSYPYLACKGCGSALSGNQISECDSCHVSTTAKCEFCPNCGNRK